jgi:small-conductance mechanosensitive channel
MNKPAKNTDRPVVDAAKTIVSVAIVAPLAIVAFLIVLAVLPALLTKLFIGFLIVVPAFLAVAWFVSPPKRQYTTEAQQAKHAAACARGDAYRAKTEAKQEAERVKRVAKLTRKLEEGR